MIEVSFHSLIMLYFMLECHKYKTYKFVCGEVTKYAKGLRGMNIFARHCSLEES